MNVCEQRLQRGKARFGPIHLYELLRQETPTRHAHTLSLAKARMDLSILAGVTAPILGQDRSRTPAMNKGGLVVRAAVLDDLDAIDEARTAIPFPRIRSRAGRCAISCARRIVPVIVATIDDELAGYALVVAAQGRAARRASIRSRSTRASRAAASARRCCRPARNMRADNGRRRADVSRCATTTRPPSRSTRSGAFASSASTRTITPTARPRCATRKLSFPRPASGPQSARRPGTQTSTARCDSVGPEVALSAGSRIEAPLFAGLSMPNSLPAHLKTPRSGVNLHNA